MSLSAMLGPVLVVLCCVLLLPAVGRGGEKGDWQLTRWMGQSFDGPNAGRSWGEMLLMGVDFADARRGVIGGFNDPTELRFNHRHSGMLGYTRDGGRTFKFIKTRKQIFAVTHGGGDTFWAAGYGNLVMRSRDAGATWKTVRGAAVGMPGVQASFRDANRGVIAGHQRKLYATEDGKRFHAVDMPSPVRKQLGAGKRPNALNAVALGTGGFGIAAGGDGELLVTHDGGGTWAAPPGWRREGENRVENWLWKAAAVGKTHAWCVGDNGAVVRTTDGGKTFDVRRIPGGEFLTSVAFADKNHGWALGWHNAYRTTDGGETWRLQANSGGVSMQDICVRDAQTAWIVGHYGLVQHTTDGGKTWRTLNDYTDLHAVVMIDDALGFAGAESGAILKTTDGGRSWEYLDSPRGSSIEALCFLDAKNGWAVGDFGHVVHTRDGGRSWRRGKIDFPDILKDVHRFDAGRGVAVGARGAIFATADGAATWRRVPTPTDKMLYAVDFPTPKIGYASGEGVVLKTTDGGATWRALESPTGDILSDVRFVGAEKGWMVGDIGMVFATADGGETWKRMPAPTREWLHRIELVSEDAFLVAGSRGTALYTPDGGSSWAAMKTATGNNVYCISRNVAVGRWGQVQRLGDGRLAQVATEKTKGPEGLYEDAVLPAGVTNVPAGLTKSSFQVDRKGRLTEVRVNGVAFGTNRRFPTFTVLTVAGGKGKEIKTLGPDDKGWTIRSAPAAKGEKAFVYDSDLLTARVSYTPLPDRLVVRVQAVAEKEGKLLGVSAGDGQFVRLPGDTPERIRNGALAVPVDGGERIGFSGFTHPNRKVLHKTNHIGGWTFKNRMISFADGRAGLVLRSQQWHAAFHYGQGAEPGGVLPTRFLYMGWSFDTRAESVESVTEALKAGRYARKLPHWLAAPLPIDTFGFDLQYVGDINADGAVNWVDAAVTYREGNYKRTRMIDESPAMCGDRVVQAPTCFMLWDNPFLGNTHSDSRALSREPDGRPTYKWGAWSRSVDYELKSGRLARFYDKIADDFEFPRRPCHLGSDTWTCAAGEADFSPDHPSTAEQACRAKVATLQLLARRGYRTDSEALSEWGLAGNLLWGWWTPYVGNGVWPGGFSRCWEYIEAKPDVAGSPVSHLYGRPIPLQTVLFQGLTYSGAGYLTPPGYAMFHGGRPTTSGIHGLRHKEFFYYPWLVLWKTLSPHPVTNVRALGEDRWEMTYRDGSVLKLDVQANTWVLDRGGITYDGYSPPNPYEDPLKSPYGWGVEHENYRPPMVKGSFGVWRSGTFTVRVAGVRAVKPPRVVGAPTKGQAPPPYTTQYRNGVLSITIRDKGPKAHPMLVFEPAETTAPSGRK